MDVKQAHRIVRTYIDNNTSYRGVGQDQVVRCAIETLIGKGNCSNGRIAMAEYALLIAEHAGLPIEERDTKVEIAEIWANSMFTPPR